MKKSALAALISVLFVVFSVPAALAKESSATSVHRKKTTVKKATVVKKRSKAALSHAGHHKNKRLKNIVAAVPVVPEKPTVGDMAGLHQTQDPLDLKSSVAFVMDQTTSQVLFEKNSRVSLPIASITKLMTSLIVLDAP